MRRMVFIGCGGSGNAVIGYLMDRLKATLHEYGFDGLPQTWQFLVIDARQTPEPLGGGLGTVAEMGGHYLSVSPAVGSYQVVDSVVSQKALNDIATWAPRPPEGIHVPVQEGAGQMRSVGRVLAVSRATMIYEALNAAADRTMKGDADAEALASVCGPLIKGVQGSIQPPMAVILTSMAGGSGASMALDVARLLSSKYNRASSVMFAFTPDIFDNLGAAATTGVRPNSLAMLGEVVSMQLGESRATDAAFMKNLGVPLADDATLPIRRVIPVGRTASDGTPFGDGTNSSIYRALGSALSALIVSEDALEDYIKNVIENNNPTPVINSSRYGWGTNNADSLQWGSFGFARLSMGRDRYGEYAAQRLARSTADHVLRGHLLHGDDVPGDVQLAGLITNHIGSVQKRIGLPVVEGGLAANDINRRLQSWLSQTAYPQAEALQQVRVPLSTEIIDNLPRTAGDSATLVGAIRGKLSPSRRAALGSRIDQVAYRAAYDWHVRVVEAIERETSTALARNGALYARSVLDEIRRQLLGSWGAAGLRAIGRQQPDARTVPSEVESLLSRLTGQINDVQTAIVQPFRDGYSRHSVKALWGRFAELAADACEDIAKGVVDPLSASLSNLIKDWEKATDAKGASELAGLAVTQTNDYKLWPADHDHEVAERWFTAQNEVLLTDPSIFIRRYATDLSAAVITDTDGVSPPFADARNESIGRILSGNWPTEAGERAPGSPIRTVAAFVSNTFKVPPEDPDNVLTTRRAEYHVALSPEELLTRSRAYIARPNAAFSTYIQGTLRDFAATDEGGAAVVSGFRELLEKAQPLVQVDPTTFTTIHGSQVSPHVSYSFSAIPLSGLPITQVLEQMVQPLTQSTQASFSSGLTSLGDGVTDISAFAYFPKVLPPVFDNILRPVREQWAGVRISEASRREFWAHRRARPLTGSLAVSREERRALIGGWLLGQITGELQVPRPPFTDPVRVWDRALKEWVAFPHPMLYSSGSFVQPYEWLPAVLESHLLALAEFGQSVDRGEAMRPYEALRALWDAEPDHPTNRHVDKLAAERALETWIADGNVPSTVPSRVRGTSAAERASNADEFLAGMEDLAQESSRRIVRRAEALSAPVYGDLANDVREVAQTLRAMVATTTDRPSDHDDRLY